jgi:hypothetical protein
MIEVFIGAFLGWIVTFYYYKRQNIQSDIKHNELVKVINKIPDDIWNKLSNDTREKLSVAELNDLINKKVIDKTRNGLDAYKLCPKCGEQIHQLDEYEVVDYDLNGACGAIELKRIVCHKCGWEKDDRDLSIEYIRNDKRGGI